MNVIQIRSEKLVGQEGYNQKEKVSFDEKAKGYLYQKFKVNFNQKGKVISNQNDKIGFN